MTSKENFRAALLHKQPERLVVDFGSTPVSGIHVSVVENLREYFGLQKKPVKVTEPYQMLGEVDEELMEAMGVDVMGLPARNNMFGFENTGWKEFKTFWDQEVLVPGDFNTSVSEKGDLLIYPEGDLTAPASGMMPSSGYFFDTIIRQETLVDGQLDPEDNLEEFDFASDEDLNYWKTNLDTVKSSDKAIVANFGGTALGDIALVPAPFLKNPKGIRDVAEWYMATMMHTDYIHAIFDKSSEIAIANLQKYFNIVGNNIDVIFICGTDFGTQESTFCAPETFDELWMPYYQRINNWIHENTSWFTFKHSCGAVESFMSRFIEAGFDIINPVQINAKGMDPALLKEKYGTDLVFWGGGVDTQQVLPFGSVEDVKQQVLKQCEILGKNGGFVFNTVHNIQAGTPTENVIAMLDAIKEYNGDSK